MDFGGYEAFEEVALGQELETTPPPAAGRAELAQANRTYAALVKNGVRIVIGKLPSHSNKLALVFVPPRVAEGAAFDVRVHYHGMYATAAKPAGDAKLPERMWKQIDRSPTTVFVFPFASAPPKDSKSNFPWWGFARQSRKTALEALQLAGVSAAPRRVVVSGHSAGGRALAVLARRGGLDCDLLILEDCLYGTTKREIVAWSKTPLGQQCREVIYFHGTNSTWMCPADLPSHAVRLACTNGKHYGHVLLDPLAPIAACGCPAKKTQGELEEEAGEELETPVQLVSRSALIPFTTANLRVDVPTAKSVLKLVCLYLDVPWPLAFTVMEHEGGVAKLTHPDGVMQVIDVARDFHVPRIPQTLKQQIVGDTTLTGDALNRSFQQAFRDGTRPSRRLAAQIAAGVQELKYQLDRYSGFAALAFVAYNTGNANAWVNAQPATSSRYERCRAAASAYHQPASGVLVTGGQWLCDPRIPTWAWQVRILDQATNRPLRGFKYLRQVPSNCSVRPPVAECTVPKATRPCSVPLGTTNTRWGALDKLFDISRMGRAYRDAVRGEWPALVDDGRPVHASGTKVEQVDVAVAQELEFESFEDFEVASVPVKVTPVERSLFVIEFQPPAATQQAAAQVIFGKDQAPAGFELQRSGSGWGLRILIDETRQWPNNIPWAKYQAQVKPAVQEFLHKNVPARFNVPKPGIVVRPLTNPNAARWKYVKVDSWTTGSWLFDLSNGTVRSLPVTFIDVNAGLPLTYAGALQFFYGQNRLPKGNFLEAIPRGTTTWTPRWRLMVPDPRAGLGDGLDMNLRTHLVQSAVPAKQRPPDWLPPRTAVAAASKQLPPKGLAVTYPKPGIAVWKEGTGVFWLDTKTGELQGFNRDVGTGPGTKMWNNWNEMRILEGISPERAAEQTVADMKSTNEQMLMALSQAFAGNRAPEKGGFAILMKIADVTGKELPHLNPKPHKHPTGTDDLWKTLREREAQKK